MSSTSGSKSRNTRAWSRFEEIEKNEFNLNLPRYIDSQTPRTCRTSRATCRAASPSPISMRSQRYWAVCPQLRHALFKPNRPGYVDLAVEKSAIKSTIYEHPEFAAFIAGMNAHFAAWREKSAATLKALEGRLPSEGSHRRRCPRACSPTTPASRSSTPTTSIST